MLAELSLAVTVVLLLGALVACGWLARQRSALARELADAERQNDSLRESNRQLGTDIAVAKESQANIKQQFAQAQAALQDAFKSLSADALHKANEQFLQLAEQKLKGEQKDAVAQLDQRKLAIESLVKPIGEKLEKATSVIGEIEKSRKEAYGGLKQHLAAMVSDQKRLRDETANLVKALRRPEVRGQWGEMQLRRVAELAGMAAHCDFTEQATAESGTLRPDMVVDLPGGRQIVVDAKTPITAYIDAAEATEDAERDTNLARHVRHIEDKVAELGSKRYQDHFQTADFVVLFIPGESFLYAAASRKPDLIESAMNRNVVIATPTTLISLLKVVALGWREEQLADNAKKIKNLGQELHKRVATLTRHLDNLGKAVGKTVEHYNKFVGSYESQVMVQTRKFQELGADSPKELPAEGEIPQVEIVPRELRTIEANPADA
ncbi:MAG: DNA recombination protein RmuC [Planctomycetota bacterium]